MSFDADALARRRSRCIDLQTLTRIRLRSACVDRRSHEAGIENLLILLRERIFSLHFSNRAVEVSALALGA
jgi:hypothetical protein